MAVWGSYESGKELAQSGVGVLWAARPAGATDSEERFVIKTNEGLLFLGDAEQTERGSALFLESARAQKALTDAAVPGWARILECGRTDAGAFYVADRYERSVQKIVVRGIKVGGAGLRQVVLSIVDALIVLRSRASRPHGNLKTTNVLIGGPDGPTVDKDPVVLTDLKPGSALSPKDAEEDIRAIGRLVYEMVMLRPPRDSVGLTVSMTSDWSRLGGAALAWIDFVNRLLDVTPGRALPDLVELREMIPSTGMAATTGRKLPLLAVGSVLALLVAAGATYFFVIRGKPVIPPPPPPPLGDAMKEDDWLALLGFIKNVLSKRSALAKSLQADDAVWKAVPADVQRILSDDSIEMPWKFLDPPDSGWGDPYITLAKVPGVPSAWEGPQGLSKGDAAKLGEWRRKAEDLRKQADTIVQWINKLLPSDAQSEWGTATWGTLGWNEQIETLTRLQGVTVLKMGQLKFNKDEDLVNAVRFSVQGKQLGEITKALVTSMKVLEDSGDEALSKFPKAVEAHTKGGDVKDLIAKATESQTLASAIGARLADKSGWDRAAFSAKFKSDNAEKMSGQGLAIADFKVWLLGANSGDYALNQKLTGEYSQRSLAAVETAKTGLSNYAEAIKDPSSKRKIKLDREIAKDLEPAAATALGKTKLDEELFKAALTTAKETGEALAKERVFESNRKEIEERLQRVEALARLAQRARPGDFETIAALVKSFTDVANSDLSPGFRDALLRQVATVGKTANPDLSEAQRSLEEDWLDKLKKLSEAAVKAMPDKFAGETGADTSKFNSILAARQAAALKAVGDSIKDKPPSEQEIAEVAQLAVVVDYGNFKRDLEGIVKNVAISSARMQSGDWAGEDKEGKAAAVDIARIPAIKTLAEDKANPNEIAGWKANYDEVIRLRALLANPSGTTFDAAVASLGVNPAPVLNRVVLTWNLVLALDAASSPLDKARLGILNQKAGDVIAAIDAAKPAAAASLKSQIAKDKETIWLSFMSRVPGIQDQAKRLEALIAGRDMMSTFGFDEANRTDPRLASMPGTLYNLALLRIQSDAAKLEPDPAGSDKNEAVAAAARKKDADEVQKLLTQLRTVAMKNGAAIAGVADPTLLEELDKASKPSSKPAFAPDKSGPKSQDVKNMDWKVVPSNPSSEDTVTYKWKDHELVFRKLEVEGQKETTYLCTREVSLGLFMDVAEAAGVLEGVVSPKGLTKLPGDEIKDDPATIGPRVWNQELGGRMVLATGTADNLFGWYRLPSTHVNPKSFPGGIPFLPANSGIKVAPPSTDLPVQYITPASAILVAHRMGCRLPTRADFAQAAKDVGLAGANLRDKTWKVAYDQMQRLETNEFKASARAGLIMTSCFPHTGIFQPVTKPTAMADSTFYDADDGTLFFKPTEPPASSNESFADLIGNVAEFIVDTDQDPAPLADKIEQSLAGDRATWQDAIQNKVLIVGGSALSPPPGADKDKSYDNKTPYPYPTGKGYSSRGFSDVGFRLAFSAAGGGGSPIEAAKKALAAAKFAPVK